MGSREISGNVGEWSEIYTFLKLLSERVLRGADENLNPKEGIYYEINKIIRKENKNEIDYVINEKEGLVDIISDGKTLARFIFERFGNEADILFRKICESKGRSFHSEHTKQFMNEIYCTKLKAPSKDKTDIRMDVYDPKVGMNIPLGFSIKSYVGSPPTLLNPGYTTNFFFEIDGMDDDDAKTINSMFKATHSTEGNKEHTDISNRMKFIKKMGYKIKYEGMESETFCNNMMIIDSRFPEIIGAMLIEFYINGVKDIKGQVQAVSEKNPIDYNMSEKHPFYSYKVKRFLSEIAIGMVPNKVWNGTEEANGGYIIVKETGDIVCYHLYHKSEFEDYLFNNTEMDKPSTSRYGYASVERKIDGKYRIKLNLQIRFKSRRNLKTPNA